MHPICLMCECRLSSRLIIEVRQERKSYSSQEGVVSSDESSESDSEPEATKKPVAVSESPSFSPVPLAQWLRASLQMERRSQNLLP